MKKVLIISYFFPPCNLTASQRIGNWVKYLPDNGIKPIVVSRFWEGNELNEYQQLESKGNSIVHITEPNHEIFYLPYHQSFRDYLFIKGKNNVFYKFLSKMITYLLLIFQNTSLKLIPFKNIYHFVNEFLKNNKDVNTVVISGTPFEQFYFGYLLKKKHPQIDWYADYRDDWNTSEIDKNYLKLISKFYEKKWLKNCESIISVSEYLTYKISEFVDKKGHTIYNGFDHQSEYKNKNNDVFSIVYNGTLYPTQDIETFLDGFIKFIIQHPLKKIHFYFPGLAIDESQAERVRTKLKHFKSYYTITERLPKEEVIEIQKNATILLMLSHKNIKGIPSSKLFEYISLQMPFIVYPSDNDIIEKIALESKLGLIVNNSDETLDILNKLLDNEIKHEIDVAAINQFSVKHQVLKLSYILKKNK
jgi:glycosyltransferase involved in cell wall biosynthesis